MNIKLTLGERLKNLRAERHLKLETLAGFYGVTTDYLLGVTENKKRPDAVLFGLASERWCSGRTKAGMRGKHRR